MSRVFETSENQKKDYLKTRYYKTTDRQMLKFIPDILKAMRCDVLGINEDYAEISAYNKYYDISVKVVMVSLNETSVDVFVSSRYIIDINKSKHVIEDFYSRISKNFEFLGLALHSDQNEKH